MTIQDSKLYEWIKRYLPAEIMAIFGTVLGGLLIHYLTKNPILTALGATWGENIGYYGKIINQEIKKIKDINGSFKLINFLRIFRNLLIEFGPAEYLDSFLIRPFVMFYVSRFIGNLTIGLIIGKLLADITFYIPTVISYELSKKYIRY